MGCGNSKNKDSKDKKEDNTIPYEMKDCLIPEYQEVFDKGSELLKNTEDIRAGLLDTVEAALGVIEGDRLVDGSMYDGIKALLITSSGINEGKFPTNALDFSEEAPFIVLKVDD